MYKPFLYELSSSQELLSSFGGYNKNEVIEENSFYFEENMSSTAYPLLTPRVKRGFFNVNGDTLHGLFAKSKLIYVKNNALYYGGERVEGLYLPDVAVKRQFVSMGARLLIFPDKLYLNTLDLSDFGSLEAVFEADEGTQVTFSLCRGDGELYEGYVISDTEPEKPSNGDLWLDTSASPHSLKQFSESLGSWLELAETYVRIACPLIGKGFNQYDGVTLEGAVKNDLNGSHIIYDRGEDFITVTGIMGDSFTQTGGLKVSRLLPDMDFVCESSNRLWGCSCDKNEIYASKLGDPTNFNFFMGISSDSYAVSVGSDGEFTGAVPFRGYVLFFKESCVHKIYGQNPPFTLTTSYIRGVQKGSGGSLVILNESLYYKSPGGVCVYDGGIPVDISKPLGGEYFTDAVAGACGDRYYICMSDKKGERSLFVFDESKTLWHREDNIDISEFACHNFNLYFIAEIDGEKRLCLADGVNRFGNFTGELKGYYEEDAVSWVAQTGLWGLGLPENKYYSSVVIRLTGEKGARLKVEYQTNSDGKWREQINTVVTKTGSMVLPFTTPRCDHLQIRLSGRGNVKIYSISRKVQRGSELNV